MIYGRLHPNGLSANGLSANGLSANGLSANGLSANGLFPTWFNQDPATSNEVMTYLYRCAAPLGTSVIWKNPQTGVSYTWWGLLGLAPTWTSGKKSTVAEQQVISACLAAHVNKYGMHVAIAIEGRTAKAVQIGILPGELATFSVREACFFGNLFTNDGIYAGVDHTPWSNTTSSSRACAFDTHSGMTSPDCPPIFVVGTCAKNCQPDSTGTFYESCTYNGKTYQPVTTRLLPNDLFTCGDGVCQISESCGNGGTYDGCKADCGVCP